MAQTIDIKAVRRLSVEERLGLIEQIWATIDDEPVQFTAQQWTEIQRRLDNYRKHPESALSYKEFKASMRKLTK